ncbi:MAG: ABC transporter [Thermoleophilia bacterium]
MSERPDPGGLGRLGAAVGALRDRLREVRLPLDLPGAADVRAARAELVGQMDDYILPRLASLDAPLLAVVGGSTGAGKSTLVNSIVGGIVSRAGVLRPTTNAPVLVHNPDDERWFVDRRVLPDLARITGQPVPGDEQDPGSVRLVPTAALPAGLALLDAPDIDSVVSRNRSLAGQLLAAADMWIFVTTAARYADAVPWQLLRDAAARGTSVTIVLNRVPEGAQDEIHTDLAAMLSQQGLGEAPIFVVTEVPLDPAGLLPQAQIGPLRDWLTGLAADQQARSEVVRQTLTGALDSLAARTEQVAAGVDAQDEAVRELREQVDAAYRDAAQRVGEGLGDGSLLRGEVLARWQDYVGTGELFKQVESTMSRLRDRLTSFIRGKARPAEPLGEALHTGAAALIVSQGQRAATQAGRAWRGTPAGEALLAANPQLAAASANLPDQAQRVVRDWQGHIFDMVRVEGKDRRTTARFLAYGVNGVGVLLMLATFASTGGLTGAEAGIAGGSALLAQKVLEAIFGDQAVRTLADKAREDLSRMVTELFAGERQRYDTALQALAGPDDQARTLRDALAGVRAAR